MRALRIVCAAALLTGLLGCGNGDAPVDAAAPVPDWRNIAPIRALLGDITPSQQGIELGLPLVSEDGSAVPLTVSVHSAMTIEDYVQRIYLFATGNPTPEIAAFVLTPALGRAELSTRVRLNESQWVYALAQMQDDSWRLAAQEVQVTVSGCLSRPEAMGTSFTQPRVGLPRSYGQGAVIAVRTLVDHPMETGLRPDGQGSLLSQHIVETMQVRLDDELALQARFYRAISMNPYLQFHLRATTAQLSVHWQDDQGAQVQTSVALMPDA